MKVDITLNASGASLKFIPESSDDETKLKSFAELTMSQRNSFGCYGFEYLKSDVKFVMSPLSARSD
jgi:hypothetical protein